VRVAWVSHQWPRDDDATAENTALLPGRYAGGAELLQDAMRSRAPAEIEWVYVDPRYDAALDALKSVDRTIVGSLDLVSDSQLQTLARHRPLVWVMSKQHPRVLPVLEAASPLVWVSAQQRLWYPWAPDGEECSGWFDTSEIRRESVRDGTALWAARDHPQKGLFKSRLWAADRGVPFRALTNRPRAEVLDAMSRASWFVLLANDHDPCPAACVEAEIAGCEVITNGNVGRVPVSGPEAVAAHVESNPSRFYGWL